MVRRLRLQQWGGICRSAFFEGEDDERNWMYCGLTGPISSSEIYIRSPSWCGNVAMGTCLILWEDYRTLPEVQPLFRFKPPRKDAVLFVDGCPHTEQTHDTHSIDKMTSWQSLLVILTYVSLGFLHQLIYLRTRFSFIRLHALVSSGGKADNSSPRHFVEIKSF